MQGQLNVLLHYLALFITQSKYANGKALFQMLHKKIGMQCKYVNTNTCKYASAINNRVQSTATEYY